MDPGDGSYRIELRSVLDQKVLASILELIDAATALEGHRPVGEHKYSHLRVGASGWVGVLAYEADRLVGYAHTRWNAVGSTPRMAFEVVVHPEHYDRDVARQLVYEARGVLARAGGGLMYLWVHRVEDAEKTLARRMGLSIQRQLGFMSKSLTRRPTTTAPPADVVLRPYRPDVDDDEFLRVNNTAFAGHPENGGWDHAELAERRKRDWFDPDGLIMAWRSGRCIGFHWTKWHGHDSEEVAHEPVGEVYVLAVHPEAQGLGLGRILLSEGLAYLYDAGCRQAVLYVDTASTSAVRLYESDGFTMAYREVCYEDYVAPVLALTADDLSRPG